MSRSESRRIDIRLWCCIYTEFAMIGACFAKQYNWSNNKRLSCVIVCQNRLSCFSALDCRVQCLRFSCINSCRLSMVDCHVHLLSESIVDHQCHRFHLSCPHCCACVVGILVQFCREQHLPSLLVAVCSSAWRRLPGNAPRLPVQWPTEAERRAGPDAGRS